MASTRCRPGCFRNPNRPRPPRQLDPRQPTHHASAHRARVVFFGFVCHPEKHPQQACRGSRCYPGNHHLVPYWWPVQPAGSIEPPLPTSLYLRGLCTSAMDLWSGRRNPWLVWVALHTPRHSNRSALGSHLLSMHGLSSRRPRRDCWPTRIKSLVSTQHGLPVFAAGTRLLANTSIRYGRNGLVLPALNRRVLRAHSLDASRLCRLCGPSFLW